MRQFPFPPFYVPNIYTLARLSITLFPEKLRNAESIPALDIDALSFQVILIIQEKYYNNKPVTCF